MAWTLSNQLDRDLLTQDGDGDDPRLDAHETIDHHRIGRMSRRLNRPAAEIQARYVALAKVVPLQLEAERERQRLPRPRGTANQAASAPPTAPPS
jgi:hypothetical protein